MENPRFLKVPYAKQRRPSTRPSPDVSSARPETAPHPQSGPSVHPEQFVLNFKASGRHGTTPWAPPYSDSEVTVQRIHILRGPEARLAQRARSPAVTVCQAGSYLPSQHQSRRPLPLSRVSALEREALAAADAPFRHGKSHVGSTAPTQNRLSPLLPTPLHGQRCHHKHGCVPLAQVFHTWYPSSHRCAPR